MNAMSTGGILPQTGPFVNAFCRKKSRKMKKFPISAGKIAAFQKRPPKSRAGAAPYCNNRTAETGRWKPLSEKRLTDPEVCSILT
ncbi:MAG: hypothetical protein Q4D08_05425 [Clostridia bacterium]|nr:hypothetical protein [Clostridia bacterium]